MLGLGIGAGVGDLVGTVFGEGVMKLGAGVGAVFGEGVMKLGAGVGDGVGGGVTGTATCTHRTRKTIEKTKKHLQIATRALELYEITIFEFVALYLNKF